MQVMKRINWLVGVIRSCDRVIRTCDQVTDLLMASLGPTLSNRSNKTSEIRQALQDPQKYLDSNCRLHSGKYPGWLFSNNLPNALGLSRGNQWLHFHFKEGDSLIPTNTCLGFSNLFRNTFNVHPGGHSVCLYYPMCVPIFAKQARSRNRPQVFTFLKIFWY
jgi:hypothetical protein